MGAFDGDSAGRKAVSAAVDAGHRPVSVTELGYTTRRCAVCGSFWPCAEWAQAIETLHDESAAR